MYAAQYAVNGRPSEPAWFTTEREAEAWVEDQMKRNGTKVGVVYRVDVEGSNGEAGK